MVQVFPTVSSILAPNFETTVLLWTLSLKIPFLTVVQVSTDELKLNVPTLRLAVSHVQQIVRHPYSKTMCQLQAEKKVLP